MNTVFFIGGLMGLSSGLKPSVKVLDNISSFLTLDQLKSYLLEMFECGEINTSSTLVFDVTQKKEAEVILFLKNILPEAKNLFANSWYNFQKGIVLLLPEKSTIRLNEILNQNGLLSFVRTVDVEDYLEIRGLTPLKKGYNLL